MNNDMHCNIKEPLVSICCQTYNHDNYIRDCLNGFIIQKTTFLFEILIHDDASTDGTTDIIREYERKYPDIIKPIYQSENQYSQGRGISATYQFPRARGKYIAFCEGDDYWTDPYKLQKQVEFLERNHSFSVCFHHIEIVNSNNQLISNPRRIKRNYIYNQKDFLIGIERETYTCSIIFRKACLPNPLPSWFYEVYAGDKFLKLMLTENNNKAFVMKDTMAHYRKHPDGIWSGLSVNAKRTKNKGVIEVMIKIYGHKYMALIPLLQSVCELQSYYNQPTLIKSLKYLMMLLSLVRYPRHFVKNFFLYTKAFCSNFKL